MDLSVNCGMEKICKIEGCSTKSRTNGMCSKHNARFKRTGSTAVKKEYESHGMENSPEYRAWCNMKKRCEGNHPQFKDYGGRGIKVCERWRNSFLSFFQDMGQRPSEKHTLDRKENDGNYEPSNCRWVVRSIQNANTRPLRSNNVSGVKGVGFHKAMQKWRARISFNGKMYGLGYFDTKEDATAARGLAEKKYHAECR